MAAAGAIREHDGGPPVETLPDGFEIEGSLMDKRAVARLVLDAVIDRRESGRGGRQSD